MKIFAMIGLLATIVFTSPAEADFYRYKDRHGNVIYTDDLKRIPADRRSTAKIFSSTNQFQPAKPMDAAPKDDSTLEQADEKNNRNTEQMQLRAIKEALEKELAALIKENAELKEKQKAAVTPELIKAVNKKAVRFNARYQAYQEKKAAYKARLEAFRKRPDKANADN